MSMPVGRQGHLGLNSDPREVDRLFELLDDVLGKSGLGAPRAFGFRCAVVEVFNNCCRHAYLEQHGLPINVAWSLAPKRLEITLSDHGPEFTGPNVVTASHPMAASGRGFEIILAGADRVNYRRKNGWNQCRLELDLS